MLISKKRRGLLFWLVLGLGLLFGSGQVVVQATHPEAGALVINEFVATNGDSLVDEDGESSDWIEIYNRSSSPVNLAGWALTDDPEQPHKWPFPQRTLGSHEYLVVFASGKDRTGGETLHTSFRLNKDGDFLALYNLLDARFTDALTPGYPLQFRDVAYGRYGDDNSFGYLDTPTPGSPNDHSQARAAAAAPVTFSQARGYYQRPLSLELSTTTPGATIRYTTDGSPPLDSNGTVYTEPLDIDRTTTVLAAAFKPDHVPSPVAGQTYIFSGPDSLPAVPALSLAAVDLDQAASGRSGERPVAVELIDPAGERPGFQVTAGLRRYETAGGPPVFRLFFRGEYGATELDYPLFSDAPVDSFNTLLLVPFDGPNQWLRESQVAMSKLGAHGLPVRLYLNGQDGGLYTALERPDSAFMAAYVGGEAESWFVARQDGPLDDALPGEQARLLHDLFTLLGLAGQFPEDLAGVYAEAAGYLDPDQLSDVVILNWYAQALDWPAPDWYVAIRLDDLPGRGRLVLGEPLPPAGAAAARTTFQRWFEAALENPDFKLRFADRLYRHLAENGPLADSAALARWQRIQPAETAVAARMEGLAADLIRQAREAGYYPPLDPPLLNAAGSVVEPGFVLTMALPAANCPDCVIYYTTDGSDPRLPVTGEANPAAAVYDGPVVLAETARVKARLAAPGPDGLAWSALQEATFSVTRPGYQALRISEIMYNPPAGDDYEFIEFHNTGNRPLELANLSLVEGIYFTFPPHTPPLEPGEHRVLVSNPAAFAELYPDVPVAGSYDGHLSNKGEKLILADAGGQTVLEIEYSDGNGWPVSADGRGDSLVLRPDGADPNHPQSWRASTHLDGSPGAGDPAP